MQEEIKEGRKNAKVINSQRSSWVTKMLQKHWP